MPRSTDEPMLSGDGGQADEILTLIKSLADVPAPAPSAELMVLFSQEANRLAPPSPRTKARRFKKGAVGIVLVALLGGGSVGTAMANESVRNAVGSTFISIFERAAPHPEIPEDNPIPSDTQDLSPQALEPESLPSDSPLDAGEGNNDSNSEYTEIADEGQVGNRGLNSGEQQSGNDLSSQRNEEQGKSTGGDSSDGQDGDDLYGSRSEQISTETSQDSSHN